MCYLVNLFFIDKKHTCLFFRMKGVYDALDNEYLRALIFAVSIRLVL